MKIHLMLFIPESLETIDLDIGNVEKDSETLTTYYFETTAVGGKIVQPYLTVDTSE